ncbi:MAG: phenylalanine--tRNA ligase subunit beta, partial [Gammaproteobacteria bacterium]
MTNYVMLETGQPMHAFDDELLKGTIEVRFARSKESLVLLDEQSHELTTNTLVICDDSGPVAMAGIMGGQETAVSKTSRNIFLESAFFSPEAIMGRARQYGLHTDASHRYERGVNPQIARDAVERLTGLILQVCGGQAGPVTEAVETSLLPTVAPIILRAERIQRLLGMSIPNTRVADILRRLGFGLEEIESGWRVSVPPYRFDVEIEADLIEEIARIHGYHQIAGSLPKVGVRIHRSDNQISLLEQMMRCLTARGYREAITYSFVDQALQDAILGENNALPLLNPISTDMAVMRQSLWPGLLQALSHNLKRQQPRARLFEAGKVFKSDNTAGEQRILAGVIYGNIYPEQWDIPNKSCDFYDIKSDVEALLATS